MFHNLNYLFCYCIECFFNRGGVLYVFADANQRLPNHAVPLHSGQCGGCRRVPHPTRPHTFEIILHSPGTTFQLAAADEYEVSDWLQAFVQAASGVSCFIFVVLKIIFYLSTVRC